MISLARHIELLLLEHDCVIVPGLGAFIANNASACYNEENDNLFLPPYRNIYFNQKLVTNDGLLVQSYMNVYDAAYPEAYKQMCQDIADLMDELDLKSSCELKGIGTLSKNIGGNITFTSFHSGILTPALYGLYSFTIKNWEEVLKERQARKTLEEALVIPINTTDTPNNNGKIVPIQTRSKKKAKIIDIAVASVASVLLFFLFSYPALISSSDNTADTYIASSINIKAHTATDIPQESQANKEMSLDVIDNSSIVETNENSTEQETISEESNKTEINDDLDHIDSEETIATTDKKYVIVLATCVAKNNANILIDKLQKDGYNDVVFDDSGKMNRVTYSSFETFEEANKELSLLRHLSPYFKDAWVYNISNK